MVLDNVAQARKRISEACARCGRSPGEVTLIAVTKTFASGIIREAMAAGVTDFGENYVREFIGKFTEFAGSSLRWHYIGHLQRNKVKEIVGRAHLIHSVDSLRLGEALSSRAQHLNIPADILIEVNTSGETTKFGVQPGETAGLVRSLNVLPGLNIRGFMTIGPFLPDPEASRPAFRLLRELRDSIRTDALPLAVLSMGMSNDFEVAIEEGATMIRIGTMLFGTRISHEEQASS